MKRLSKSWRVILLTVALVGYANAKPQSGSAPSLPATPALAAGRAVRAALQTEDEVLKLLARTRVELEHCQEDGKIDKRELADLNAQLDASQKLIDRYKKIVADYEQLDTKRGAVAGLDNQIAASFQKTVDAQKAEIDSLRTERNFWKTFAKVGMLGILVAFGAGYIAGGK